jgi:hypothetical protein
MNAVNVSDNAIIDKFLNSCVKRSITIVEGNCDLVTGSLLCCQNLTAQIVIGGHGLLGDNITSGVQGTNNVLRMISVNGGNDDGIGLYNVQHFVKVFEYGDVCARLRYKR